jgi:ABC-2 type transport system ATP-binding protein
VVAFLGPNSAGKTTTLKILAGIMSASFGEATIAGFSAAWQSREVKRHVGYMPEHNPLPEDVTVEDFLRYRARLKELRGARVSAQVEKVCALCDLAGKIMRRPIGVLSRGVRQRVGIADALLTEPPILLLDEPTIGLDPHQVMSLRDLIRGMRGAHTIILSTHILSEAEVMADRILIINKGRKVVCGTPEELKEHYGTGKCLELESNLSLDEIKAILEKTGGALESSEQTPRGLSCRIAVSDESFEREILKMLVEKSGLQLSRFARSTPTLESIFLQATAQKDEQREDL